MAIVIVDYESGNLHSAQKAFQRMATLCNAGDVIVTSDPGIVAKADRIILPGDGAYPACRAALYERSGLFDAIEDAVINRATPFLGICIGMQMMATRGLEYAPTPGFDWISGEVRKIETTNACEKIPHMGWNDLIIDHPHPVLDGIKNGQHVYFVHSYQMVVQNPSQRIAHVNYGNDVTAIIGRDNMVGFQFHPEKSQDVGLKMIGNFLKWAP